MVMIVSDVDLVVIKASCLRLMEDHVIEEAALRLIAVSYLAAKTWT